MKQYFKLLSLALAVAATMMSACKPEDNPGGKDPVYADVPFSKITVTSDGETVEGTIVDDKNINFHFNKAESFNDATLAVTVNEGYELTYPTSLEHIDLQAEPVVNFKTPKNATVKYWLKFSSDAFPIVDEGKIHIQGFAAGEHLTIDNGTKTFTVKYDKEILDYENVTLVFEDGALQEGATVKTDLTYDFTDGLSQPLVIDLGGDRNYTVTLDVSSYIGKTPGDFGFQDETYKYVENVEDYPFLQVWRTDRLTGIPVYADAEWAHANPYEWDFGWAYDDASDWGYQYGWVDEFSFLGDWAEDRATMTCIGPVVIVTLDRGAVKGAIVTDSDYSMKLGDVEALVTAPGFSDNSANWGDYMVFSGGKVRATDSSEPYRSCLGFNAKGKPEFATGYAVAGGTSIKQIPFQSTRPNQDDAIASATDWDVVSAAWALPWIIRDGVAMGWEDILRNDSAQWSASFGQGWQSMYPCHLVMGVTYDNKIGLICNPGGCDKWDGADSNDCPSVINDGGWFKGITPNQMAWIVRQLGWKDVIVVSGQNGEGTGNASTVRVNGKSVFNQADHPYTAEVYNNEASDVNCAYVLAFDKKN